MSGVIGAVVFDPGPDQGLDQLEGDILGDQFGMNGRPERGGPFVQGRDLAELQWGGDRLLADGAHRRQTHAIGRQDPGQGMEHDPGHAQGVGDHAGVLAPGPAETVQHIAADVVAALDRDGLDRLGHVLNGDGEEALGQFDRGHGAAGGGQDLGRQGLETLADRRDVQRLVGPRRTPAGRIPGAACRA